MLADFVLASFHSLTDLRFRAGVSKARFSMSAIARSRKLSHRGRIRPTFANTIRAMPMTTSTAEVN
jgi:hypothetical protein